MFVSRLLVIVFIVGIGSMLVIRPLRPITSNPVLRGGGGSSDLSLHPYEGSYEGLMKQLSMSVNESVLKSHSLIIVHSLIQLIYEVKA